MVKLHKHVKEPEIYYYFNASGEKLWMYRHKYYDSLGKRKEKKKSGFKTDKAAIKALMEVKALTLRGNTKSIEHDNLTISQWFNNWYETNELKWEPTTKSAYKNAIDKYIVPLLGNYKMQKLDKSTYQREFINELIEMERKPRTIRLCHRIFNTGINAAVEEELLDKNRFKKVALPDIDELVKENYLSEQELNILLEHIRKNESIAYYTAIMTLAFTGMRKGELMGLLWKNVDFENHTITIERTRDFYGTRTPKTKNSNRTIPVDKVVIDQLYKYRTWSKEILLKHGKRLNENSHVFISREGAPVYNESYNRILRRAIEETKVKPITIHGLRHTHATILLNNNENVKAIADRLGNTPKMIYEVYGHLTDKSKKALVDTFANAIGAKSGAN